MRMSYVYNYFAHKSPELALKLDQAGRLETPAEFVRKILHTSAIVGAGIFLFVAAFLLKYHKPVILAFPVAFLTGFLGYVYLLKLPDMIVLKANKEIDREIVYAGKFLIVELNAGVTLYDGLKTVSRNYPAIGRQLQTIINEIDLGTSIDDALNHGINATGSQNFRKFLWQILNAHQTGADVAQSLNTVLDQILREQVIEAEKYGKKLNPIAMFYLMIAVVIPSLGMIMVIIVASFLSFQLSLVSLLFIAALFMFIQYMFVAIIKSMRPAIQL